MSGRSVLQNLNEQSKAGVREEPRGRFRTKDIEITNLYPNSGNFCPHTRFAGQKNNLYNGKG